MVVELTQRKQAFHIEEPPQEQPAEVLTAYEFLLKFEPRILDILYDPKNTLIHDATEALAIASRLGIEAVWTTEHSLTHGMSGVISPAFPPLVWELVYN